MLASSSVPSRRKQAKPQRLAKDVDPNAPSSSDQSLDYHVCGICSARYCDVEAFLEHKRNCLPQKQSSSSPCSDADSAPMDLSRKTLIDDLDNKTSLEDKSNTILDPIQTLQQHQKQLLELYAQLAASQSLTTDSEQSSEDGGLSYVLSPPSISENADKVYLCAAARCIQRFPSRGSLLWHILRRHPHEKLLQCLTCDERFSDFDQVRDHQCGVVARPLSTGSSLRSSSPDADRGSVPARTDGAFTLVRRSPSPPTASLIQASSVEPPLSQMLFSQLLNSASAIPSPTSTVKESAMDLSATVGSRQMLSMPPIPQPMIRPFSFGMNPHHAAHPDVLLGSSSASTSLLSNDDDWEALMEISTTDESEKIRALVGDKALPTTDPNQCLLCRRVLSCKSALQMHYRTHTGERPFKCKICQRAFTTKGNLKTHMGVHRAKHSFRGIASTSNIQHQCPICQKRFFTAHMVQQHIAQHTSQLTRNGILPPFDGSQKFDSRPLHQPLQSLPLTPTTSGNNSTLHFTNPALSIPLNGDVNTAFPSPFSFFVGLPRSLSGSTPFTPFLHCPTTVPSCTTSTTTTLSGASQILGLSGNISTSSSLTNDITRGETQPQSSQDCETDTAAQLPLLSSFDSSSIPTNLQSVFEGTLNGKLKEKEAEELLNTNVNSSPSSFTCSICSKKLLNQAALEIHLRSHVKDRPVKCTECSSSFTSKVSLRQHLLTHGTPCRSPESLNEDSFVNMNEDERMDETNRENSQDRDEESQSNEILSNSGVERKSGVTNSTPNPLDAMQKMWAETEPPPPRQAPVLSKHQCGVCFKHFSSSSALQIHMRTHTGDKPFKCEVCSRAFTTRGNLKVHMGTHMWQQNPSRRGRRIFEFGADGLMRPEMISPMSMGSESSIRQTIEPSIHVPFNDTTCSVPPPYSILPFPLPLLPPSSNASASTQMDAMVWMWKTVCSVCQKICASPQELEQHLKMHLNGSTSSNTCSPAMLLQKND